MRIIRINPTAQMPTLSALPHDHDAWLIQNRRPGHGVARTHQLDTVEDRRAHSVARSKRDQTLGHPPVAATKLSNIRIHK